VVFKTKKNMKEVTIEELKELQIGGKKILADFKAKWCVPCKNLIPRLESLSNEYGDVVFVTIDVDDNRDNCMELGIRSVPTVMIFNGETLIDRSQGANPDSYYKDILNRL
jgi:thioredoxin